MKINEMKQEFLELFYTKQCHHFIANFKVSRHIIADLNDFAREFTARYGWQKDFIFFVGHFIDIGYVQTAILNGNTNLKMI